MKPSPTLPPVTATGKLLTEAIIATLRAQLAAAKKAAKKAAEPDVKGADQR